MSSNAASNVVCSSFLLSKFNLFLLFFDDAGVIICLEDLLVDVPDVEVGEVILKDDPQYFQVFGVKGYFSVVC